VNPFRPSYRIRSAASAAAALATPQKGSLALAPKYRVGRAAIHRIRANDQPSRLTCSLERDCGTLPWLAIPPHPSISPAGFGISIPFDLVQDTESYTRILASVLKITA
jgi:hypothetical protein